MSVQLGRYWHLLVKYLKPQWGRVALLAIFLSGSIGLQLINPQIIRAFVDTTQTGGTSQAIITIAVVFTALATLQRALSFFSTYMAQQTGWAATNTLREDLALHCLRLDMPFHKTHTPGELIERIDDDVTALANFFSQFTINVAGNGILLLGLLLLLLRENWLIGTGFAVYGILAFFALRAIQGLAVQRWTAERESTADFYGFLEEHISGTEDIRAAGAEQYVTHRLFKLMRRMLETTRIARLIGKLTYFGTNFLYAGGYTAGLALGAYLYSQKQITIGTAYVLVYYIGMLAQPLENIRNEIEDLQQASASIGRVEELLRIEPQVRDDVSAVLPKGDIAIEFKEVNFSYEQQKNVLQDISFQLQPGHVLGLLGRTGSGKTTLARLLFRLYDPSSGSICLNGIDIRNIAMADLREHVGMVTQDVQLFQASVRDNLTFFKKDVSDAQIKQVLEDLELWQWVQSLPEGLETQLAAGGQSLSAGEAQLLAFTRVFLKNPGLVLLDEASSRLDPATEHLLEQAVDHLLQNRTGIVIAHRLRTVQRADEIMILEDGCIVEYGSRTRLANDPHSHFYGLLQAGLEEVLA